MAHSNNKPTTAAAGLLLALAVLVLPTVLCSTAPAPMPACKLQFVAGVAAVAADCTWKDQLQPTASEAQLEGKQSLGRLPFIYVQADPTLPAGRDSDGERPYAFKEGRHTAFTGPCCCCSKCEPQQQPCHAAMPKQKASITHTWPCIRLVVGVVGCAAAATACAAPLLQVSP